MYDMRTGMLFVALMTSLGMAGPASAQTATDVVCSLCVSNGDIANNAVRSSKIADGTVTASDLANDSVTNAEIASRAVTYNKLDVSVRRSLDNAISDVSTLAVEDATIGVASAACPSSRIAVSASCLCDDDGGFSNNGVLFACAVDGNGAVAACFDEAGTFNPTKESPVAIVQAICLGGETSDGTPWVPPVSGAATSSGVSGSPSGTAEEQAAWHKAQHEKFTATVESLRQKQAAHRSQMRAR